MNNKLIDSYIRELIKNGFNGKKEELVDVLLELEPLLEKDRTPEELTSEVLNSIYDTANELIKNYKVPGYHISNSTGLINTDVYSGIIDQDGHPMTKENIFDVASISKEFTQLVSFALMNENYYNYDSIISDLHPKFDKASNLTIRDLMEFSFSYKIDGRIENAGSVEEAKSVLHTLSANEKNKYTYIDFGMMALKEVMEHVTGKEYSKLVKEYVTDKLDMKNTYLVVLEEKRNLVTGTPNAIHGLNNDMKAIKMGGYSGNAGILATSDDIKKLIKNLYVNREFISKEILSKHYTESEVSKDDDWARGYVGNACTTGGSFVGSLVANNASGYQGSTRTQTNGQILNNDLSVSTTFFNPGSMSSENIKELEEKSGKSYLTEYEFEGKNYKQLAAQAFLPVGGFVKPMTNEQNKLALKLGFLNHYIKSYDPNYNKTVNVEIDGNKSKK